MGSDAVKLGNLYLAHVIAYVAEGKVTTRNGDVDPDEHLMRFIEFDAAIEEHHVNQFREAIYLQSKENRVDLLYSKLEEVLEFLAAHEYETVKKFFDLYD